MIKNDLQNKLNKSDKISKMAENVETLHTHTHTCSFIGKIDAIFASFQNINFRR